MSIVALQRTNGFVIYSQISKLLKEEITACLKPGECLPSEYELAMRFGVNRHTIRHAIEELVAAGLLERRHGKGTFVLDAPTNYLLGSGTRFTQTFESLGKTAGNRILRQLVIPARGGVATRLRQAENEPDVWT